MYYRVHGKSESSTESVPDRLKLLRYMFSEGVDRSSTPVFLFRYLFWLNWIRQRGSFWSNFSNWRYQIAIKFIFVKAINVIGTSYFWLTIYKKLRIIKI